MRKQIGFTIRTYQIGRIEGLTTPEQLNDLVKAEYLDNGWEVFKADVVEFAGNRIMLAVSFVKYEEVPYVGVDFGTSPDETIFTKRGPGRPKKLENAD